VPDARKFVKNTPIARYSSGAIIYIDENDSGR
jgi:hypothetical protein